MSESPIDPLRALMRDLEPRVFIDAVLSRWHIVATCAVVVPIAAMIFALLSPPTYSARAVVRVQSQVSLTQILEGGGNDFQLQSRIPVVLEVVNSRPVAREILLALGEIDEETPPGYLDYAIDAFHARLQVTPFPGGIVQIRFKSRDADDVVRCIRMLVEALRDAMVRPQIEALDASVEFLAEQLERMRVEISELESAMTEFHAEAGSQRPEVYQATLDHYASLLGSFATMQTDLVAAEERLRVAQDRLAAYDPERSGLERRLDSARRELGSLRSSYTEDHPEVVSAARRVESLESELADYVANPNTFNIQDIERIRQRSRNDEVVQEELANYRNALSEVEALRQQVGLMQTQIDDALSTLATFSESSQRLANLQREAEAKSTVYTRLLAQHEEALVGRELTTHEESRQVWIIEQPNEADPPERSKLGLKMALIGGLFAGFLLAGLWIALAEFFDRTVRGHNEAARLAGGVPVIGSIPPLEERSEA